jgi:hypothetical protein
VLEGARLVQQPSEPPRRRGRPLGASELADGEALKAALVRHHGNYTAAANELGVSRRALARACAPLGLPAPRRGRPRRPEVSALLQDRARLAKLQKPAYPPRAVRSAREIAAALGTDPAHPVRVSPRTVRRLLLAADLGDAGWTGRHGPGS